MSTFLPSNGGKKIKPPPPPPPPDPLRVCVCSSARGVGSSPYHQMPLDSGVAAEESFRMAKNFILNQRVAVNIEGCGWILGTVVLFAKAVKSFTGTFVRVRFSIPTERNEREADFPNHPDHIRPL